MDIKSNATKIFKNFSHNKYLRIEGGKFLKGNIEIVSRESENSLYDENIVTFEDDKNSYDQSDATGFIKINALRLKLNSRRNKK